jgi:hypothetical protein
MSTPKKGVDKRPGKMSGPCPALIFVYRRQGHQGSCRVSCIKGELHHHHPVSVWKRIPRHITTVGPPSIAVEWRGLRHLELQKKILHYRRLSHLLSFLSIALIRTPLLSLHLIPPVSRRSTAGIIGRSPLV